MTSLISRFHSPVQLWGFEGAVRLIEMTTSLRGTIQSDLPTAPFGSGGTSSLKTESDVEWSLETVSDAKWVETWRCGGMGDADDSAEQCDWLDCSSRDVVVKLESASWSLAGAGVCLEWGAFSIDGGAKVTGDDRLSLSQLSHLWYVLRVNPKSLSAIERLSNIEILDVRRSSFIESLSLACSGCVSCDMEALGPSIKWTLCGRPSGLRPRRKRSRMVDGGFNDFSAVGGFVDSDPKPPRPVGR